MNQILNNLHNTSHWGFLIGVCILCFIVCRIPYLGVWFRVFDTLMHETGHAICAFFFNGEVNKIELNSNLGGKTIYKSKSNIVAFIVLFMGYPFSTWLGTLFLFLNYFQLFNWVLYIVFSIMTINLVFWVRNSFGLIWLIINLILFGIAYRYFNPFQIALFSFSISGIMIIESFYATIRLLIDSLKGKNNGGDDSQLKQLTGIPSAFWAFLFFASSLFSFYLIFNLYTNNSLKTLL